MMRNFARLLMLAVSLLPCTGTVLGAAAANPNLLKNGGFEERSAAPWGTGLYSGQGSIWWNSGNCKSQARLDEATKKSGLVSLYIYNPTPKNPNVYGTTAQRVTIRPNQLYRLTLWAKGNRIATPGAVSIVVDSEWKIRPIQLPARTFSWKKFESVFSLPAQYVDIRILSEDKGEVWLDDMSLVALDDYLFSQPRQK